MEGKIKWYNPKNGYGFIAGEDGGDYFVHFTAIPQGVKVYPDDRVSFDAVDTEKGKQAQNVQKIADAESGAATTEESAQVPEEASPSEEIAEVREEAPEPTQEESEAPSVESEEGDSTGKAE